MAIRCYWAKGYINDIEHLFAIPTSKEFCEEETSSQIRHRDDASFVWQTFVQTSYVRQTLLEREILDSVVYANNVIAIVVFVTKVIATGRF